MTNLLLRIWMGWSPPLRRIITIVVPTSLRFFAPSHSLSLITISKMRIFAVTALLAISVPLSMAWVPRVWKRSYGVRCHAMSMSMTVESRCFLILAEQNNLLIISTDIFLASSLHN